MRTMRVLLHTACGQQSERGWGWGGNWRLTLYSVLLHFLDLGDGLPQVICELFAVLGVRRIEVDEDFDVCTWNGRCQSDPVGVIWRSGEGGGGAFRQEGTEQTSR